jgi:hypothetical protein
MKKLHFWAYSLLVGYLSLSSVTASAQGQSLRIAVTGESNLRAKFVQSMKDAGKDEGLSIEVVPRSDGDLKYTVIIAQESSLGGAAAAVIALDRDGEVIASVVRSGRMSGSGAMNACAKELAKKLAILAK